MNTERLKIFTRALDECKALRTKYPDVSTIESVINQLEYLIGIESGVNSDRSRLRDIIIGAQTAREIEILDEALAELLYKAAGEARTM